MSLLSPDDLASLLVFESLTKDWVREVHIFNSKRKRGKTFVIFRNHRNKTVSTLEELRLEFDDASFLDNIPFTSGHSHDIVSNKVGAGKIARKAAKKWMEESANRPTEKITKNGVKYGNDIQEKASMNKDFGTRESIHLIRDKPNLPEDLQGTNKKQSESGFLQDADGFLAPTKLRTNLLITEKELFGENKYDIIDQQTKDVFKSKELESGEEECATFENKRSPQQKKMYTADAKMDIHNNEKIKKGINESLLITQPQSNLMFEKTINKSDEWYGRTMENLQSKKDGNLPQSKANENVFQNPQRDFQDTVSDSYLDSYLDSDSDSEATFKENEKALLYGKPEESDLIQSCFIEPADINEYAPISNKLEKDSDKNKLTDEPKLNCNLSLNESSDAWMHDYIGCLDDDEGEEECIEKGFPQEKNYKPKTIGGDILETFLEKREVTPAVDRGDESILPDILPTMDDADIKNVMKKEDNKTWITDQSVSQAVKKSELKNVQICTSEPAEENESISKLGKSVEDHNETKLKDEPNLNIHLSLTDSSDAWMHDYIGSMDDDESEEESSSEKEAQLPLQSNLNEQLQIPLDNIPNPESGQINLLHTFLPEKDDMYPVDISDATIGKNYIYEVENENSTPSYMGEENQILMEESTKTKMLSLPLHESSDAWMAEDLGSMADDDDSEEDLILERKKTLPLQTSNQKKQMNEEIQEDKLLQDTGLIDVLHASNEYAMIKGNDETKETKEKYTSYLPLKESINIKTMESNKEDKGTTIELENTKVENSHYIEHTTGGSHDLDENKSGLIDVLTNFLKESNSMAISDKVNSEKRIKVEKDVIKEYEDSTVIDEEDKQGLKKDENVMEKDQMFSFKKGLKNTADTEEDIGKMDSEEVISHDESGLVGVLKTFMAEDVSKSTDVVLKEDIHDVHNVHDPNIKISEQTEDLQISADEDQTDSDENSSSDDIFDDGTDDSDLGSSDTDPDSDFENESKEDSDPAKSC